MAAFNTFLGLRSNAKKVLSTCKVEAASAGSDSSSGREINDTLIPNRLNISSEDGEFDNEKTPNFSKTLSFLSI